MNDKPKEENKDSQFTSQEDNELLDKIEEETATKEEKSIAEDKPEEKTEEQAEKPTETNPPTGKKKMDKRLKIVIISVLSCIFVCVAVVLCSWLFYDGGLAWKTNYEDLKADLIMQSEIKLGVDSKDGAVVDTSIDSYCEKMDDAEKAVLKGSEVTWNLKNAHGKCTVKVTYRLKTIEKTFTVIPTDDEEIGINGRPSGIGYEIDEDSDDDEDEDGLSNKKEKELGTKLEIADTDEDGLSDGYEVGTLKTDPLKADSDDDGLDDYNEEKLGLDPLKADSKGDGKKDGERELSFNIENGSGIKIEISGSGNIAGTGVDVLENTAISNKDGIVPKLYNFYTDGNLKEAKVTIPYTDEDLAAAGISAGDIKLLNYDTENNQYSVVESEVDEANKVVYATLKHFSYYVLGKEEAKKYVAENSEVLFVLDNSWSMYTNEQYKEITGDEYIGWDDLQGSDSEGKRFSLTSDVVGKIAEKGMKVGLSEFRGDYSNINKIGSDASSIKSKLNGMNGKFVTSTPGTKIGNALTSGMNEFDGDSIQNVIVILTDGQDTGSFSSDADDITKKLLEKNVKVCVIGFGDAASNAKLSKLAEDTGCQYVSSSDSSGLEEVFDVILTELSDGLVDVNEDGTVDGVLIADSGFIASKNGFSFENYSSTFSDGGHCYGMALFAQLYYRGKMPLSAGYIESPSRNVLRNLSIETVSYPYNLENIKHFKNNEPLYDYKLKTDILKYTVGFKYFDQESPKKFYSGLNGDTLTIDSSIKSELSESGLYSFPVEETELTPEQQEEKHGFTYKNWEDYLLDDEAMQENSTIDSDDKNLLNAIFASFISQYTAPVISSGIDGITVARAMISTDNLVDFRGSYFINKLYQRISSGEAPVIGGILFKSGGRHAINAISLIQDIKDPSHYYIGVYDNNYPGERRILELSCGRVSCMTKSNNYYDGSGDPIYITLSEQADIDHFNSH